MDDILKELDSTIEKDALQWNPQQDIKIGRPREAWRKSVNKELGRVGKTWYEARRLQSRRRNGIHS